MLKSSTLLHLRIPFSFFLLPIFLFSLSQDENFNLLDAFLIFLILHFFLYPASNGYNSYFDKDEESIGGLENPPPVSKELYSASLIFDLVALAMGFILNFPFVVMLFVYGMISKAYSHPSIRLKKFTYLSWLTIGFFQGYFTFMTVQVGLSGLEAFHDFRLNMAGVLSTILLLGSYPMTQVYQHNEDSKRGDKTLSLRLGIRGTFLFTAAVFMIATGLYAFFFHKYYSIIISFTFLGFLSPVLIYFLFWFFRVLKNDKEANFKSTMRLNFISSLCLNLFFLFLIIYTQSE